MEYSGIEEHHSPELGGTGCLQVVKFRGVLENSGLKRTKFFAVGASAGGILIFLHPAIDGSLICGLQIVELYTHSR